jgi:tetratricopeptide (TPR) repeat protein
LGCAYEGLGKKEDAAVAFNKATLGQDEPIQAIYYNDPQPDKILYQALAWIKLRKPEKAKSIFERFIDFGKTHIDDDVKIEYFAVSLPDMLVFERNVKEMNRAFCTYLTGLGYLGLNDQQKSKHFFNNVLEMDINHQGAAIHLNMLDFLKEVKGYVG